MRQKIRPIGNSKGIILPAPVCKKKNIHVGDEVEIDEKKMTVHKRAVDQKVSKPVGQ